MASTTPSKSQFSVQHNFEGDASILNATVDRRTEVRKALAALAQDLQRIQGSPAQIQAEVKFQIGGGAPKEHVYKITVTENGFDAGHFASFATGRTEKSGVAGSNGHQATPSRPGSYRAELDDDVVDIRPFKRQKTNTEQSATPGSQQKTPAPTAQMVQQAMPPGTDDMMAFLKTWHDEWTRQGGWLYDTLTKSHTTTMNVMRGGIEKKMDMVQDVIGQSLNAASAGTMNELTSITKLCHWLEHCRKTSADKVQAREEKWRSSSATFHDSTRKEREAAEKRIEKKLDEHNELLRKLARSNNVDLGELCEQQSGASEQLSREASLGAQLTAELNNEASRHARDTENEPFSIED